MAKTLFPVTFMNFQNFMNRLGYFLGSREGHVALHWRREGACNLFPVEIAEKLPLAIATLQPDFECDGYKDRVYERDYVVDFVAHLCAPHNPFDKIELVALLTENHAIN